MKRYLLGIILTLVILSISASAGIAPLPDDFVGEGEFTIASIHEMRQFVDNEKNPEAVEDVFYAIADLKDSCNIQFVSLMGELAGKSIWDYSTTFQVGKTGDEVIDLSENQDKGWDKEYKLIADNARTLTSEGIPFGVSVDNTEFYAQGQMRDNRIPLNFSIEKRQIDGVEYNYYDDENFYIVINNGGVPYILFQLEIHPVEEILNWFNSAMADNPDKRAIIFTASFLDNSGDMYTMWNWEDYNHTLIYPEMKLGMTTTSAYAANNGVKARDGHGIWKYALSKYDNVYAVISSKGIVTNEILTSVFENERGVETLAIGANPKETYNLEYDKIAVLLTKFSNDGTVTTCYYIPGEGYIEESLKTVKLGKLGELAEPNLASTLPKIEPQYNGANSAYILGYEGNLFKPNNNMTRAEACTIFARLLLKTNDIPTNYTTRFDDVKKSDWFYGAIAYLDEMGFFYRNENTTYKPNEPITRAEFVELANSASTLLEKMVYANAKFKDVLEDHFYYDSIMAAARSGLVNGYEDNTFRPDNTITRGEVVTVINRLLGLSVSEKTVSPERVENSFKDIDTHWARLNVLMASNSAVHGEYYYESSLDGVVETADSYTFKNNYAEITVSKKDGKVTSFINLDDGGKQINNNATSPQFIYLLSDTGSKVLVQSMETDGNRIKITFKNRAVVYMIVDIKDDYMTFEIDSELPSKYGRGIVFANFGTNIITSKNNLDTYRIGLWAMSWWTIPSTDAFTTDRAVSAAAYNDIGDNKTMGAKAALVLAKVEESFEIFKETSNATDRSVGLASTKGGAFSQETPENHEDYVIVFNLNQDNLDDYIDLAVKYDMDVLDLHQSQTFSNGSFEFGTTSDGTAKAFNKEYMTKIKEAGLSAALHTYAFFLDDICTDMTSDPKWQKDIQRCSDSYTLDRNITKNRRNIPTIEDASGFDTWVQFDHYNTNYVLIDEEIIEVKVTSSEGFLQVVRGVLGTEAVPHLKGAKIEHLMGRFGMLSPVYGSPLFWEIADRTAKAYNEGGFTMIYMDAIDGFKSYDMSDEEREYWYNAFVHRILSQCHDDPVVEFSSQSTQMWNVRGRSGAIDTFTRGIKKSIQTHRSNLLAFEQIPSTGTLGWFDFFPDANAKLKNTIQKTIFHDDLDVLGTESIAFNYTMVYNNIDLENINNSPFYQDNLDYYAKYSKIRKSNYFTEETCKKIQALLRAGHEFKVVEKSAGEYAFLEMYYSKHNVGNVVGDPLSFTVKNTFKEQKPFIRIEQRYSTLFENPVTMIELDETKSIKDQTFPKTISSFDMSENMVIKVNVQGTGKDGDAIVVDLVDYLGAVQRYFIDLNYTGWKEHVLLDCDYYDWDQSKYAFPGVAITYQEGRMVPQFSGIVKMTVRAATESSKNAMMDDIVVYKECDVTVTNPSVTVGSQTMTFDTELLAGEYLEYDPVTDTATRYTKEETKETVPFTGNIKLSNGSATGTYKVESSTVPTVRAKVVFGFSGEEITNS